MISLFLVLVLVTSRGSDAFPDPASSGGGEMGGAGEPWHEDGPWVPEYGLKEEEDRRRTEDATESVAEGRAEDEGRRDGMEDYLRQLTGLFEQLEGAVERVFRHTVQGANGTTTHSETTEEEVAEDGSRWLVYKSLDKTTDGQGNSSVIVAREDIGREKRSNWMSEPIQKQGKDQGP